MADALPSPGELLRGHTSIALVLDEITDLGPLSATGLWTPDERYYDGHDVGEGGERMLPGHWTMESVGLIGACAVLAQDSTLRPRWKECRSIFRMPVLPGDTLEVSAWFEPEITKEVFPGGTTMELISGKGRARVGNRLVYRAPLMTAIVRVTGPETV